MSRLVVAYPGVVSELDGQLVIDEKLRSGVVEYQRRWPGGDVVLATRATGASVPPGVGTRTVARDQLGFDLVTDSDWASAVRKAGGDLILTPLLSAFSEMGDLVERTVLVAEFTPEELARNEQHTAGSLVDRARITVGSHRRRRQFEAWSRDARGVQCNGYPAYERFGDLTASSLLFFDTRLTEAHVEAARRSRRATTHEPARLCFSGRLIAAKGPDYALDVVETINAAGQQVELAVFGGGDLESALRARRVPGVTFRGGVDFATEWTRYVREEVDLMLLPHTQGDPSGTYLEAAGCGAPVIGFDNVALTSLVEHHGIGAVAPIGDARALADVIGEFLASPDRREAASRAGLEFMAVHHAAAEFDRRVEHLRACG